MSVLAPISEPGEQPRRCARRASRGRQARFVVADALRSESAGESRGRLAPFGRASLRGPERRAFDAPACPEPKGYGVRDGSDGLRPQMRAALAEGCARIGR